MSKYKLRIHTTWYRTKKDKRGITATFVWDNKEDALACKTLLLQASKDNQVGRETDISFVEFTDEVPL